MVSRRMTVWCGFVGVAIAGIYSAISLGGTAPVAASPAPVYSRTLLSETYVIDRKYRSMMGPHSVTDLHLGESEAPELLWIIGYSAEVVGSDGETPMAAELMCHSNLDIDQLGHAEKLRASSFSSRLFTLSQGQLEVRFPDGFGIPIRSDEVLSLTTQVLNLNLENPDLRVRHKITLDYLRDRECEQPIQALFPAAAFGLALLEGKSGHFGVQLPDADEHGPGCLVADNASDSTYTDNLGRTFTGHWVVKPGREVNRTLVTELLDLPYDTKVHYIAVHLHPFAESLELRDLTTGESLFKSRARNLEDRVGLSEVGSFSSAEGIPMYTDHEYEVVSIYNNTTEEDQDSMAVMYLYLQDQEFEKYRDENRVVRGRE